MRRNIDICTVNRDKKFWLNLVIWGTFYVGIYMGGRQIFETSQEIHKRGDDNKSNNKLIDKVLIQMSLLLVLY
jgi:hypothetical protein